VAPDTHPRSWSSVHAHSRSGDRDLRTLLLRPFAVICTGMLGNRPPAGEPDDPKGREMSSPWFFFLGAACCYAAFLIGRKVPERSSDDVASRKELTVDDIIDLMEAPAPSVQAPQTLDNPHIPFIGISQESLGLDRVFNPDRKEERIRGSGSWDAIDL
jgi:hypothetical protein